MVPSVVFLDELYHSYIQLQAVACRVQVDVLPLQGAEEPLDEGIVGGTAFAIHRDLDPCFQQGTDPMLAGVLRPLVGIHNLRYPISGNGSPKAPSGPPSPSRWISASRR